MRKLNINTQHNTENIEMRDIIIKTLCVREKRIIASKKNRCCNPPSLQLEKKRKEKETSREEEKETHDYEI